MSSLVLTITETLRYRGALGQWSWVLHRISGLGVVLFLTLHVIDTSWSVFYPALYVKAIAVYQTPLFTIGEFALIAAVVYHALNGLRIAILDYRPALWRYQARAAWIVLGASVLLLIPVFILMFGHVLNFYNDPERRVLPFADVLESQLPFAVGIVLAVVAGVLYSGIHGVIAPRKETPTDNMFRRPVGSRWEKFWWSYMRVSGFLIVPLVFGHLAMMHVIQGVFDITAADYVTVGTNVVNQTGTSVEFVANRWNYLVGGIAVWRLYDIALLALTVIHGFNGLRYVLTDYTADSTLIRRGMIYTCIIGALILLMVGGLALLGTIDQTAIRMAEEAVAKLHP
ncbi:MAG: succinate dehydrogenase, cytochrome b556 subunit [Chloroflexi bacterium]|nr:succinate dehydrogenase, cytochrome b556 subunit [Chloroflexota bacterium]